MPDAYTELLDATIQHLERLKERGFKHVNVSPEKLAALASLPRAVSSPTPLAQTTQPRIASAAPVVSAPPIARPPTDPAKLAAFTDLRARALVCVKCPNLASSRKNVVFGVGSIDTELMFVGEAPGADEDRTGEPFVGKAGQLLTKIIQTMGFFARQRLHREHFEMPAGHARSKRGQPQTHIGRDGHACISYLHEQIDIIKPKVLVALGGTAVEGLLGKTVGIMKLRGNWQTYRGIPLMPTYHPAYLLRNQALSEKRRVWEDMLQVLEKLGAPISEKQRNYFSQRVADIHDIRLKIYESPNSVSARISKIAIRKLEIALPHAVNGRTLTAKWSEKTLDHSDCSGAPDRIPRLRA